MSTRPHPHACANAFAFDIVRLERLIFFLFLIFPPHLVPVRKTACSALLAALGVSALAGRSFVTDSNDSGHPSDDAEQAASDAVNDAASSLKGVQDDLAGMFADINDDANTVDAASALVKAEHITLTDVRTGEVVATCEDKDAITSLVSGFDFPARQSAEKPSEAIEHTASFQQRATAKLGESAETAEEVELRTLTTYEGPDALTLRAGLDEPRFHAPADAAALRFLAQR